MAGQVKLTLLITSVLKGKDAYKQTQQGLKGVGQSAGFAATAMKALTVIGIGAFLMNSIKKAAEFSDTMMAVKAATGATEDQFRALETEAKRIGEEFGKFTATEAAEGMQVLSYAGFTVEETLTAIEPVMKLSQAGMMDLGAAADAVAGSLRSFGMDTSETGRIVDVMTKTFISSNTRMQELSDAIKFVGPIASQAGISFEEMNATLGVLADSAIKGGQAGTNLRNILIRMQAPSAEASKTLSTLGVSLYQLPPAAQAAERALKADYTELNRLEQQMDETSAASKELQADLNKLNVQEAKNNLEIMKIRDKAADRGEKLTEEEEESISVLEAANRDLSISQAELSIQQDEMRTTEEALKESITATEQSVKDNTLAFETAKGPLKSMAEIATEFNVAMTDLSSAQQTEALATVFGMRNIAAFQIIMRSMSDEVGEGQKRLDEYTDVLMNSAGTADEVSATMEEGLGNEIAQLTSAFEAFQLQLVETIMPALKDLMTTAKEDLIPALESIIPAVSGIATALSALMTVVGPIVKFLAETPGLITALIIGYIAWTVVQWLLNAAMAANPIGILIFLIIALIVIIWVLVANWEETSAALLMIWDGIKMAFFAVVDGIIAYYTFLWDTLVSISTGIKDAVTGAFTSIKDTIIGIFTDIKDAIMDVWDTITAFIDMITGLPDKVTGTLGDITGSLGFELPSFAGGGIVPGPLGSPQLIIAHGGEPIGDAAGGGGGTSITSNDTINLNVTVNGAMDGPAVDEMSSMLMDQIVEKKRRAEQQLLTESG